MGTLRIRSHGPKLLMGDLGLMDYILKTHNIPLGAVLDSVRIEPSHPDADTRRWEDLVFEWVELR